ncbi:Plasmodium exported protein, unknown function [Plasmodium vivax]|uniref:Plasmodium RESA N-terminal domain-containing protein n=1 Tax=Plasmodium vivax TaxID=5855 RepID=A0A1G4H9L1_PLAVI|nr:Plasmodium exported protein, unknown function [Plasmodium vivax]
MKQTNFSSANAFGKFFSRRCVVVVATLIHVVLLNPYYHEPVRSVISESNCANPRCLGDDESFIDISILKNNYSYEDLRTRRLRSGAKNFLDMIELKTSYSSPVKEKKETTESNENKDSTDGIKDNIEVIEKIEDEIFLSKEDEEKLNDQINELRERCSNLSIQLDLEDINELIDHLNDSPSVEDVSNLWWQLQGLKKYPYILDIINLNSIYEKLLKNLNMEENDNTSRILQNMYKNVLERLVDEEYFYNRKFLDLIKGKGLTKDAFLSLINDSINSLKEVKTELYERSNKELMDYMEKVDKEKEEKEKEEQKKIKKEKEEKEKEQKRLIKEKEEKKKQEQKKINNKASEKITKANAKLKK